MHTDCQKRSEDLVVIISVVPRIFASRQRLYNPFVSVVTFMVRVNELSPKAARETYESFRRLKESFRPDEFNFVLFYGNPTEREISWCPDCRTIHVDFMRIAKDHKGTARFHTVPVGSREEFDEDNPFIKGFPHLGAVPTLMIYKDGIMYLKLVDPSLEDTNYFMNKYKL